MKDALKLGLHTFYCYFRRRLCMYIYTLRMCEKNHVRRDFFPYKGKNTVVGKIRNHHLRKQSAFLNVNKKISGKRHKIVQDNVFILTKVQKTIC